MNCDEKFCGCGCGGLVNPGRDYIAGHQNIGKHRSLATRSKISKSHIGIELSDAHRLAISESQKGIPLSDVNRIGIQKAKLRKQDPLFDGWGDVEPIKNKRCTSYLGCFVAEQVLSKIFKDVKVMKYGNHGYDFICGAGYKIDVKSSATGDKSDRWIFAIKQNNIPDHFLCLAFDNREDLTPVHLWLIPGKEINHLSMLTISKNNIRK